MRYQEYAVHPQLQPYVECFWSLEMTAVEPRLPELVVPDGRPELLIHRGDRYRELRPARERQPRSFAYGQLRRPLVIEPTGRTEIVAARLRPYGLSALAAIPAVEATGIAVPLDALWGRDAVTLEEQVGSARSVADAISTLERWLCLVASPS